MMVASASHVFASHLRREPLSYFLLHDETLVLQCISPDPSVRWRRQGGWPSGRGGLTIASRRP